jgi:ubiquinone/menaquinone biosynthesis C-methylase UbiE
MPRAGDTDLTFLSKEQPDFEAAYLRMRSKENQRYSDPEVIEFPDTFFYNLHREAWARRKRVTERLLSYLDRPEGSFRLLELGCGNGWLAAQCAQHSQIEVIGLDQVKEELLQAQRVFDLPNLTFAYGDIFEDIFKADNFDYIILAQTIEYFSDLAQLLHRCRRFLKPGGEIHILDSPLYRPRELEAAKQATRAYYEELGVPEMIPFHHHHSREALEPFDYQYLYRPGGLKSLFRKHDSRFPWVKVMD